MKTITTHKFATTTEFDINKRIELGIPLTRKQVKAKKQRKANPPTALGYQRKHGVECVPVYTSDGHCFIARKDVADRLRRNGESS